MHTVKKGSVKNGKTVQEFATTHEPLAPFVEYPKNLRKYLLRYPRMSLQKPYKQSFSVPFTNRSNLLRVRYWLQMLEPLSTVYVTCETP